MHLHELVQSMSKAEKRHFKLYAQSGLGKGQSPKYLSLFDLLNHQEYYNEEKVAKKGFTYDDKSILNEKILESLHVFHVSKSVDSELGVLLQQISILYQKSLWSALGKLVKKARKLATEYERFLSLLDVIRWEKIIADRIGKHDEYLKLIEEQALVRNRLNEEMNYADMADRIIIILHTDRSLADANNRLAVEQIVNECLTNSYSDSSSVAARISYYRIKFRYHLEIKKDRAQAYFYVSKIVQLFEQHNFIFTNEGWIAIYLIALFWQRKLGNESNHVLDFIKIIENLQLRSPHTIYAAYSFGLSDCQRNLKQEDGGLIIKKMVEDQYIFTLKLHEKLPLFRNIIIFYSTFGEWEKARSWLNEILSIKRPTIRKEIQIKLRFWLLVIAYEQTPDELDKHIQSVQKYLKRAKHNSDIQQYILGAFNELDQAVRYTEKKIIWEKLYDVLKEKTLNSIITDIPVNQLQLWCESKIERTTIAEVMKQRMAAR